jgi:hypothetical protein
MKIIVAGSRGIKDYSLVSGAIRESGWLDKDTEIVSGMAQGVDFLAVTFSVINDFPLHKFPANWDKYGKSAGVIRNKAMAEYADALVAIWDGESRGTKHMIDTARGRGLKVFVKRTDISE